MRILAAGGLDTLGETEVILDSGANCGVIKTRSLLRNISSCKPVTFDGLGGTVTIAQMGSIHGLCEAYYHPNVVAISSYF